MAMRIQLRRGTSVQWANINPILAIGEVGIEIDTNRLKIGNGAAQWNDLPYFIGGEESVVRPEDLAGVAFSGLSEDVAWEGPEGSDITNVKQGLDALFMNIESLLSDLDIAGVSPVDGEISKSALVNALKGATSSDLAIGDHNHALSQLSDVDVDELEHGFALGWDDVEGKWVPIDLSSFGAVQTVGGVAPIDGDVSAEGLAAALEGFLGGGGGPLTTESIELDTQAIINPTTDIILINNSEGVEYWEAETAYDTFPVGGRAYSDSNYQIWQAHAAAGTSGESEPDWEAVANSPWATSDGELRWNPSRLANDTGAWTAGSSPGSDALIADGSVWLAFSWWETTGDTEPDWSSAPDYGDTLVDGTYEWMRVAPYTGAWQADTEYRVRVFFDYWGMTLGDAVDVDAGWWGEGPGIALVWGSSRASAVSGDSEPSFPGLHDDQDHAWVSDDGIWWEGRFDWNDDGDYMGDAWLGLGDGDIGQRVVVFGWQSRFRVFDVSDPNDVSPDESIFVDANTGDMSEVGAGVAFVRVDTSTEDDEGPEIKWVPVTLHHDSWPFERDGNSAVATTSLTLDDHLLYYRYEGDKNHSLGWGYYRHNVDGPVLNGYEGGGFASGDANDEEDVLVGAWDSEGLKSLHEGNLERVLVEGSPASQVSIEEGDLPYLESWAGPITDVRAALIAADTDLSVIPFLSATLGETGFEASVASAPDVDAMVTHVHLDTNLDVDGFMVTATQPTRRLWVVHEHGGGHTLTWPPGTTQHGDTTHDTTDEAITVFEAWMDHAGDWNVLRLFPVDADPAGSASAVAGALTSHEEETTTAHGGLVASNDERLTDARTPTAHSHPVSDITATGTPSSATALYGDGTWKTPPGGDGADLSDDNPEALGDAAPGEAETASRADHVHPMPSAEDVEADPVGTALALVESADRSGSTGLRPDGLDQWFTAYEGASTGSPVDIVLISDSIMDNGTIANPPAPGLLLRTLNQLVGVHNADPVDPVAVSPLPIPVHAQNGGASPAATSTQGTLSTTALARQGSSLSDGQVLTHVANVTGFAIAYRTDPAFGTLTIRDGPGGSVLGTVNCAATAKSGNVWVSGALSAGDHTLHITSTGNTRVEIIHPLRENKVRLWPCGQTGQTSADYTADAFRALDLIDTLDAAGTLGLVLIATGANDQDGPYSTSMPALVAEVRNRTDADVAVWFPYQSNAINSTEFSNARAAFLNLDAALIDGSLVADRVQTTDNTHPSALGRDVLAFHLSAVLSGDPVGAAIRAAIRPTVGRGASNLTLSDSGMTIAGDTSILRVGTGRVSFATSALGAVLGAGEAQAEFRRWLAYEDPSDPAAPGANQGVVYLADDGAGNTELRVRFATGDARVIASQAADLLGGKIPASLVDAKGDLIVATAADTVARKVVGADNTVLHASAADATGVAWRTPDLYPGFVVPSGAYWLPAAGANTGTMSLNRAYSMVAWLPAGSIDGLGVQVTGFAASSTVRLGLYSLDSYYRAGDLIIDAGTIDASTNGSKTVTFTPIAITAGLYALVGVAQGGDSGPTVRTRVVGPVGQFLPGGILGDLDFSNGMPAMYSVNDMTGALPATWSTKNNASPSGQQSGGPAIGVRYA